MTRSVSALVRRTAAVGLALAAALLVIQLIAVPAIQRVQHVESEIDAKRTIAIRLAEQAPRARDAAQGSVPSHVSILAAWTLAGETESHQLAALQSRIGTLSDTVGVRPLLTRTLQSSQHDGVPVVGVQLTYQIPIDALQRLLHRVETHKPAMIVDALVLQPVRGAVPGSAEERQLQVDVRILGPVQAGKREPGP